ncbi:MAG: hypothetical protein RIR43_1698, partial [Pseudomonadota bacterium]
MTSFAFLSDSSFLKCGRADPADSQTPARPYGL